VKEIGYIGKIKTNQGMTQPMTIRNTI